MIINSSKALQKADFLAGVTLLVDKPLLWTSFDVVNKIRFLLKKKLQIRKIKVGHAGTLDPLATGLLIIAIGRDTKNIDSYQSGDKYYSGTLKLGATTKSYDSEFEPDNCFETAHITEELIKKTSLEFIGNIQQIPPVFSALKIGGERAYKLARRGEDVKMKPRMVTIHDFKIRAIEIPDVSFEVHCQKGTYIRSLAHDFGKAMKSGAYLSTLRRTGIGSYKVDNAFKMDELLSLLDV